MKSALFILLAVTCAAVCAAPTGGIDTGFPPGLVFHPGTEPLTGQLVFLYQSNYWVWARPQRKEPATVYSLDLKTQHLRAAVMTPPAFTCALFAAPDGRALCLEYSDSIQENAFHGPAPATNALLCFESKRLERVVTLPSAPDQRVFVGEHVFFRVHLREGTNFPTRIVRYDPESDKLVALELPGASRWTDELYTLSDDIQVPSSNVLNFRYFRAGERLSQGTDYNAGKYMFDLRDGRFSRTSAGSLNGPRGDLMRRSDGRYVFFADTFPSEQNDPGSGHKLTLAPSSESQARIEDPMGKQFKPLAQFQEKVLLDYISPCRRYGLMRRSAPAKGKVGELGGIVSTYYLVDLFSGNHRVLIEDAVANRTTNRVSFMTWVGEPP